MTALRVGELDRLLTGLLELADVDGVDIGLQVERSAAGVVVSLNGESTQFLAECLDWQLQWEEFSKRFVHAATQARLHRIMSMRGENRPGSWSVYATTFTIDWLVWNAGGRHTASWLADIEAILTAADEDGDIAIACRSNTRCNGLRGALRGRRLYARIDLGEARYEGRSGRLFAEKIIPETAVPNYQRRPLGGYLEHPALGDRPYHLRDVSVSQAGTLFTLKEDWLPLENSGSAALPGDAVSSPPWELPAEAATLLGDLIATSAKGFGLPRRG